MSVRLPKRLSSKKKKHPKNNAQAEVLNKLGLDAFWTTPLDPASMLDISTWTLENKAPIELKDLPNAFLQRLWLLSPDARSPCCKPSPDVLNNVEPTEELSNGFGESQFAVNPLDLVAAVFMSANTFMQQEMTVRMMQCQFAVPLVLPNIDPEEPSRFLLWPLRGVVSQWGSHFPEENSKVHEGDLASTYMPMISCVKLGRCRVSKSQVLNTVIRSTSETFLHRGMDGGQLPRRISNGLIEIGWYLPTGDTARDIFPVPVVISNLRGDASTHEKHLSLLCQMSSAVVVFCGYLREKEKQLLDFCKDNASKIILIDLSDTEKNKKRVVGFVDQNLEEDMGLSGGSVLQEGALSEEEVANRLSDTLKDLLPDKVKLVTLEAAAKLAEELGLNVDEGAVCKKAMATVEKVLKGLDDGSAQFLEKQLPLQGPLWSKLAKIEKDKTKQRKEGKETDPQLQKEKKDILVALSSYKMTPAMKIFTDALYTTDKVERAWFLGWMKLKLKMMQTEKQNSPQDLFTNLQAEKKDSRHEHSDELENGADDDLGHSDSFYTDSSFEEEEIEEQPVNTDLQVSEQQCEIDQELLPYLEKSAEKIIKPESQQKEHLDATHDEVIEQQLYITSNEKEIQGEEMNENKVCFEEQIPDTVFEDQNHHLESRENGTLICQEKQQDEPEVTLAKSDSNSSSSFEEEEIEEQPVSTDLQVSEQQCEIDQELLPYLEKSAEKIIKPESQQKEHLDATHDEVIEQQLYITSNEKEIQGEEMNENKVCFEEQIPDTVFEDQNHHLESRENGTLICQEKQQDEPEVTLAKSDSNSSSSFEEEEIEEQPVSTDLQVSEQQCEIDQELLPYLEKSAEKIIKPESQQKEHLDATHDEVIEQQLYITSNEKEIQGEEMNENKVCFEEQIPDTVFEDQNHHLESRENGSLICQEKQQDEPEVTLAKSDSTSSVQQQMCLDVSFEQPIASCSQPLEPDTSSLALEHFLREMGLIFELTHISPSSSSQNVLRLPSLAADLLLYGVPLELMDGDASNIPIHWLGCVFAELKRRLPQEQCRTRVLTSLGAHHARNTEVLSALFGVKFPEGRKRSMRGVYMVALCLPDNLRKDMECDFLLVIDVEGLCLDKKISMLIHDNEMATVATGLSDVLMQNISSHASNAEFPTDFTIVVNALLRIKECGSMPICQLLAQDEGLNSVLQASQLRRVSDMLQTETGERGPNPTDDHSAKTTSHVTFLKGPWYNKSLSEPIDVQYSKAVLQLKQNLFGALKTCAAKSEATGLPEFMSRLCTVWDTVRAESFSIGLQDTDVALEFSLLCTELSQWEDRFLEHMESWLMGATKKIIATKAKALDTVIQNGLLNELKDEAREEVRTGVDKLRSKVEAYLMKDELVKVNTFKPVLMSYMDDLLERVNEEMIQRLEAVNESHCSSTQLNKFETVLEREQKSKLHALLEKSKSTNVLLQDAELEEEFESVWSKMLSNFDFRPSETDDITARVTNILKENLISRGLQKHMKKLEVTGQNQTSSFYVNDEHFGYRSRLKHMFEDNNRLQKLKAQQVACNIIEQYNQFVEDKSRSPADFSDSYITELLENVENALKETSIEIRTAFEVDLKVYLCSSACHDFQKLHDRYAKDSELLTCISTTKSIYLAEFIYQFRKRDQCQRMAQAFTSMVIKPTVLDYIYRPLGKRIVEEIQGKAPQYQSRHAFHQSLLEQLLKEDCFESFQEYLHSYDNFRLRKVQETVVAHLSESTNLNKWRQHRLGEIVGKVAAAVTETAEGTSEVLSNAKPLLERVCLTLEKDGKVDVTWASLDGPLFSITTEWDHFVTCLMELLAAMRLELAQEFSQNVDISQFLQCLPIQPHDSLFNRVRGCNKQCPLCRAPCELEEMGHDVHRALLHRPKGIWPHNSCSLSSSSCPKSMTEGNPGQSKDKDDTSVACSSLLSHYPDWNISPEDPNSQMPSAYWRYVLARFSERFAKEYEQEPAKIPEEWKEITEEDALYSLKEAFSVQC